MWFAYVENSMAWYDLDIFEVKKLISINKKGEKVQALEDLRVVENKLITSDLIQENSVDRFEKKNRKPNSNKNRNRNSGQKQAEEKPQNVNAGPNRPSQRPPRSNDNPRQGGQKPDQKSNNSAAVKVVENKPAQQSNSQDNSQKTENKNHKKPFKKSKKKFPPKNEGNA